MTDVVALLGVAFGIGIVVGMTGMGGGALMTPALIFLGVPPTAAVANDLVAAMVNKSSGALVHWREGSPHLKLAGCLIVGSVPTAFAGGFIVKAIGATANQETVVKLAIGVTLILAAATYGSRAVLTARRAAKGHVALDETVQVRILPTVLLGAFGGLIVGVTSVGSGSIIMVILLLMYPSLSPVKLVGTDLIQAVPLVTSAAIGHMIVTGIDWNILIPLILGGTPGTLIGARLANLVSQSLVRRGITIMLLLTGLTLLKVPPLLVGGLGVAMVVVGPFVWRAYRARLVAAGR